GERWRWAGLAAAANAQTPAARRRAQRNRLGDLERGLAAARAEIGQKREAVERAQAELHAAVAAEAQARARLRLRRHRGMELGLRALDRLAFLADLGARRGKPAFEIAQPVALGAAPRRRSLRICGRRQAGPAPPLA